MSSENRRHRERCPFCEKPMASENHWERHVRACKTDETQADPRVAAFVVLAIGFAFTSTTAIVLYSFGVF